MGLADELHSKKLWFIFLITISPVYIMLFRIGMDCNLMLAMEGILFYFIIKAICEGKHIDYILSGVFAGILLYTYALSYLIEFFFLIILLIYLVWIRKIKLYDAILFIVPLGLISMPLILIQIINIFELEDLHLWIFTLPRIPNYRSGEISLSNISLNSIVHFFKIVLLYDHLPYNSISEFGNVYIISIPFAIVGMIKCIINTVKSFKNRYFSADTLYLSWFLSTAFLGIMIDSNVNKLNSIYLPLVYFITTGITYFVNLFTSHIKIALSAIIFTIYIIFFACFCVFYFGDGYSEKYDPLPYFSYSLDEPLDYLSNHDEYANRTTYIDNLCQTYIYFLFSTKLSPYDYNNSYGESILNDSERGDFVSSYKNYKFTMDSSDIKLYTNYILNKGNVLGDELLTKGFSIKEFEHYNVYTLDLDNFVKLDDSSITWNLSADENNIIHTSDSTDINGQEYIVLVGWCYNNSTNNPWGEIYLNINDKIYTSDVIERSDVVDTTGIESLLQTGIVFIVPLSDIESAQEIKLLTIDGVTRQYSEVLMSVAK
jgi:hypothetical protein